MFVGSYLFLDLPFRTSYVNCSLHQLDVMGLPSEAGAVPRTKSGGPLPSPRAASASSHPAVTLLPATGTLALGLSWISSRNLTVNSCLAYREMYFKFLSQYLLLQHTNFLSSISLCIYFVLLDGEIQLMGTLIIAASKWQASGKMIITYSKVFIKLTYSE